MPAKREARLRVKAEALAAVRVQRVRVGKRIVTVSDPHVDERGRFGVTLTHRDFPKEWDTPFYFTNPPVMARTGRFETVEGEFGPIEVEVVEENPAEALKQIVVGVLTDVGWADA